MNPAQIAEEINQISRLVSAAETNHSPYYFIEIRQKLYVLAQEVLELEKPVVVDDDDECSCTPNSAIVCPACAALLSQREIEF